VIKLPRENI